jgi:hypothetical protein
MFFPSGVQLEEFYLAIAAIYEIHRMKEVNHNLRVELRWRKCYKQYARDLKIDTEMTCYSEHTGIFKTDTELTCYKQYTGVLKIGTEMCRGS